MKKINDYIERKGGKKMYKTVVIDYSPANEMLENGYELVTMSITGTAKAILVFKK